MAYHAGALVRLLGVLAPFCSLSCDRSNYSHPKAVFGVMGTTVILLLTLIVILALPQLPLIRLPLLL